MFIEDSAIAANQRQAVMICRRLLWLLLWSQDTLESVSADGSAKIGPGISLIKGSRWC